MISAFTCITNPDQRQDPWEASVKSVLNFADELVIVDGSNPKIHEYNKRLFPHVTWIYEPWPPDWEWSEFPYRYNKALQACHGDWAIRFDADYVFPDSMKHEIDILYSFRSRLASFHKINSVANGRFYAKGNLPYAINTKFSDTCFGKGEKYTDLMWPISKTKDGKVPEGNLILNDITRTSLIFFNYDHMFKEKENIKQSFYSFSMAHKRYFGHTLFGNDPDHCLDKFMTMMKERYDKATMKLSLEQQPSFIKQYVLKPEHFGYNGFNTLL